MVFVTLACPGSCGSNGAVHMVSVLMFMMAVGKLSCFCESGSGPGYGDGGENGSYRWCGGSEDVMVGWWKSSHPYSLKNDSLVPFASPCIAATSSYSPAG